MNNAQCRAWSGKVTVQVPNGGTKELIMIVRELRGAPGTRRIRILAVGEGEVTLQHGGKFHSAPFAMKTPGGMPQIHKLAGHAETLVGSIRGHFRLTRDGKETASGTFDVKQGKGPRAD